MAMSFQPRPLKYPPIFPIDKGLVLHLAFDERSGAKAYDRSGKANHGTLYGCTRVAGRRGSALSFNGTTDYVVVADADNLKPTNGITLFAWINLKRLATAWGDNQNIISKTAGNYGYRLWQWAGADNVYLTVGNGVTTCSIPASYAYLNEWHTVAGTFDAVTGKIYRDGIFIASDTLSGFAHTTLALSVGAKANGDEKMQVDIADVRIYNRALTAAEIKRLYESEVMQYAAL